MIVLLTVLSNTDIKAQSYCGPNGISTDPANPSNPHNPMMLNDYLDWMEESFDQYLSPLVELEEAPFFHTRKNPYWIEGM